MNGRPLWPWERRAAITWSTQRTDNRRFREFYRRWDRDGYLVWGSPLLPEIPRSP